MIFRANAPLPEGIATMALDQTHLYMMSPVPGSAALSCMLSRADR
jgi:hypothetical protein